VRERMGGCGCGCGCGVLKIAKMKAAGYAGKGRRYGLAYYGSHDCCWLCVYVCCLLLRQSVESCFGCAHLSHSSSLRPASACEGGWFSLSRVRVVCVSVYSTVRAVRVQSLSHRRVKVAAGALSAPYYVDRGALVW
jgi:hypothetical protein